MSARGRYGRGVKMYKVTHYVGFKSYTRVYPRLSLAMLYVIRLRRRKDVDTIIAPFDVINGVLENEHNKAMMRGVNL